MDNVYNTIMAKERRFVSRFEHVAQLTDREVDARFDYYTSKSGGDTER